MRKIRIIALVVVVCVLTLGCIGCKKTKESTERKIDVLSDAFSNNDMDAINAAVFGLDIPVIDEEIMDLLEMNQESDQGGVLCSIFELVSVDVKKVTGDTIEYEVKAPDMENVFFDLYQSKVDISDDELLQYIKDYANNTEIITTIVVLPYFMEGNDYIVNYQDKAFINAVTGGFLDAYTELYSELINGLEEYVIGENK